VVEEAPPGIRSVAVPAFASHAPDAEIGALVAEALRREIASGSALRLEPVGEADAVVLGTVLAVGDDPDAFRAASGRPVAAAFVTRLEASAVLRPADGGAPRKIGPVRARVTRASLGPDAADLAARERALRTLAAKVARDLYRDLVGSHGP
jgi:hypothetical protein